MSLDSRLRDGLVRSSSAIEESDVDAVFEGVVRGARRRRLLRRLVAAGVILVAIVVLVAGRIAIGLFDDGGGGVPAVSGPAARPFTVQGYGLGFSDDGSRLFVSDNGPVGWVLDALTGERIRRVEGERGNAVTAFSPDGSVFVTVKGGQLRVLDTFVNDTATGRELRDIHKACCFVAFSPDSQLMAFPRAGRTRVTDLRTGATVKEFDAFGNFVVSPDGRRLAVTSDEPGILVQIFDLTGAGDAPVLTLPGDNDGDAFLTRLAWSPDGRTLVTATGDMAAVIWDAATGIARFEIRSSSGRFTSLAFGSDPLQLATGSSGGTATVWDISNGLGRAVFRVNIDMGDQEWLDVAISQDGTRLMTTSGLNETTVWNVR